MIRSPRVRAVARQIASGAATLLVISVVVFGFMSLRSANEIAHQKFGNQITPDQVTAFAHSVGLDKPVWQRYGIWLAHFVRGDMGQSFVRSRPSRRRCPRWSAT